MRNRVGPVRLIPITAAAALAIAACGSGTTETATDDSGDSATPAGSTIDATVEVTGAWARTSPAGADTGAAYMTLSAEEKTVVVSVSVPADIAGTVELHETVPVGSDTGDTGMDDDTMDDGNDDMAMTMRSVSEIVVPGGGSVELAPGGMHIMMLDLAAPLELGQTFEMTLMTDTGEEISVELEVRDEAP